MPQKTLKEAHLRIKALEKQIKSLEILVTHDHLTGLLNRRGMDEALAHHFSILSRDRCEKNNFAVLYLDLDRFRGINDTYGHQIGDEVIKFFAHILTETLRHHYDVIVRLGGDEFVVILPKCNLEQAEIVQGKIKGALEANPFTADGTTLSLCTSIGIAMALVPHDSEIRPLKKILELADKAMYADKEKGRALRIPK